MKFYRALAKTLLAVIIFSQASQAYAYPWQYFEHSLQESVREQLRRPRRSVPPVRRSEDIQKHERMRHQERTMTPTSVDNMPQSPNRYITRGEFVSAVVRNIHGENLPSDCYNRLSPSQYWLLFSDVPVDAAYGPELCTAMITGLVKGYDNVTFQANRPITVAEAAKITSKAYGLAYESSDPNVPWYQPHVEALKARGGIAPGTALTDHVTPRVMGQMMRSIR